MKQEVSKQTLLRIPTYLSLLKQLEKKGVKHVSATTIATMLKLNHVQVRKDLSCTSKAGKPKVGYETKVLISDIETFLGYNNTKNAVIVGAGGLGRTLLNYEGFKDYGLNIISAFDINEKMLGKVANGKKILHLNDLYFTLKEENIEIGIITTPPEVAQSVCDILVENGVRGIWNFSSVNLEVRKDIIVQNENMAAGLALLSNKMSE